ncbi:MAG: GIY-YIG nuclease family protein [Thiolinea sp.]
MTDNSSQIVYVLTNPAMPNLVKIGKTTQLEVDARMRQLYSTGVPFPFECAFACQVKDATEVEKALHIAFRKNRLNPNREFFEIDPEQAIVILKLLRVDDITTQFEQQMEAEVEATDKQSAQDYKRRMRPPMNFHDLGIPNGSILLSKDGQLQVTVVGEKKVELQGVVCSLTEATRKLLNLPNGAPIRPAPHWTFNGKLVKEIYENYHLETGDE